MAAKYSSRTHKNSPIALGRITVASTPSENASTPWPMHTGCTCALPWTNGEEDESKAVADVVVVITV
jgi:hypothetical protein